MMGFGALTYTGYQPQFPEQEDLSIFGWTDYPDPAVGFGATGPFGVPPFVIGLGLGAAVIGAIVLLSERRIRKDVAAHRRGAR
jgi:hypothetical protein